MFPYVAYNNVFHNFAKDACQWYGSVVSRVWFKAFLVNWGAWPVLEASRWGVCLCCMTVGRCVWWCSAVSLRTLAGSSSGLVPLFCLRFFNYAYQDWHAGVQWRIYYRNRVSFAGENSSANWLLRAFALSRSFVIGLSPTLRVGMPMFSRLFALSWWMTRIVLDLICF